MIRNMDFNIATVIMLFIVFSYYHTQYDMTTKNGRMFLNLLGCVWLTALSDFLLAVLINYSVNNTIISVFSALYLFVIVLCSFILYEYTRVIIKPDNKLDIFDYVNRILLGLYALSCIASVFFPIYMVSEGGSLIRSNSYIIIYILSCYYLLSAFFRLFKNYEFLNKKKTQSISYYVIITISGAALQYFVFDEHIIIYFVYAISCLILLFAFETPDYQKMIQATEELRLNKEALETSKRREEDLTKTIHQLLKSSSWFLDFDKNGGIKAFNWSDEIKPLLGYSKEDEIDIANIWAESLHPDDHDRAMADFMAGMQGKEYKTEARLRYKDGSYHWFLCSGNLEYDKDGIPASFQGLIQNIDDEIDKRQLNEERLKAMSDLEKSQSELKKALLDAQEANRAKTTFLSSMSHDIRTPMNAIIGYAQLAKEHLEEKDELIDCIDTIKSSGDHLLSLINDVLDMSHIESGKIKIETLPCDLSEIINDIERLTKANVDARNQTYETVIESLSDPYVMCDRLRLNQILINCVGNAVKYTKEGGSIRLTLSEEPSDIDGTKNYVFRIIDNGIGMSEDFLTRIFEPFERVKDTTTSNIQGTGLGMAITKNLVSMMGGTIAVESELGKGSTFIITLPLTVISKEEYSADRDDENSGIPMDEMISFLAGTKILVVDDNKINRTVVKRLLGERGMVIDECDSGSKAVEIAANMRSDDYDIIFMDIQMPQMNGYEATDKIRSLDNEAAKNIPVVAMTANAFEEDKKMAQSHGMNGHVTKPFKIDELIKFLYSLLKC